MKSQAEIQALADVKLKEAECLWDNDFYDGAFYLAGYAVELLLKAKVCKTLNVPDFFLFDKLKTQEVYKPFKSHNYAQLLLLSGLHSEFTNELISNPQFKFVWSIVSTWEEGVRYLAGKKQPEVQNFLTSIVQFTVWIKAHL